MARSGPPKQMLSTKQAAATWAWARGLGIRRSYGQLACHSYETGSPRLNPLSLDGLRPWQEAVIATQFSAVFSQVTATAIQRRIWSKRLHACHRIGGRQVRPGGVATQLSSARFAICVYASFVVALFAYRFGVFRLAEHAVVRPGFDLVRFRFGFGWVRLGLVRFFATASATAACLAVAESICIQRIHLASFYLQHKQLHNCCAANGI